jgi:hypothetical protein
MGATRPQNGVGHLFIKGEPLVLPPGVAQDDGKPTKTLAVHRLNSRGIPNASANITMVLTAKVSGEPDLISGERK